LHCLLQTTNGIGMKKINKQAIREQENESLSYIPCGHRHKPPQVNHTGEETLPMQDDCLDYSYKDHGN
jgi:hypothetical protein